MVPMTTYFVKMENFFKIENFPWERILMLAHWFLIQKKAQDVYFQMEKFFTPTKSFLPPFLLMHYHHEKENFDSIVRYSNCYRGGKKLFIFWQSWFSTFTRRKNQLNRLKTHHFVWKRNWVADFIFSNQNGRYPLKAPFHCSRAPFPNSHRHSWNDTF